MKHWFNDGTNAYYREECPPGCVKGRLHKETIAEKLSKTISKEDILQYYITENHSNQETAEHFGIPRKSLGRLLIFYKINKHDFHKVAVPKVNPRSHESYVAGGKKSGETQKQHWQEKSEEDKAAWKQKMSESHSTEHFKTVIRQINKDRFANMSEEEKLEYGRVRSEGCKRHWRNLSPEKKEAQLIRQFEGRKASAHVAITKPNMAFRKILEDNGIKYKVEHHIGRFTYDFLVNGNIVIEINPYVTHNITWSPFENNRAHSDLEYHYIKSKNAEDNGFRCIHIWDWDDVDKIIFLLKQRPTVYARQCKIKTVDKKDCIAFVNKYHLQNYAKSDIDIGLYYNNELVSVMTFGKPRYNKKYEYELIRFCSAVNVIGGSEKLFHYFISEYNPNSIISYCDYSKFYGDTYKKLGFVFNKISIGKHWWNNQTETHITDNLLRARGFDQLLGKEYGCFGKGTNNEELMRNFGFVEIMDAGQITYEWRK